MSFQSPLMNLNFRAKSSMNLAENLSESQKRKKFVKVCLHSGYSADVLSI